MKAFKILLVDDDADDQFFFMDALSSLKMDVDCTIANDGVEAIHQLQDVPPPPSMIFLDLNMPKMNGFECLQKIKKMDSCKDIPIVIFSTSSNPKDKERTQKLGAKRFFTKTSDYKEFKSQLGSIFDGEFA